MYIRYALTHLRKLASIHEKTPSFSKSSRASLYTCEGEMCVCIYIYIYIYIYIHTYIHIHTHTYRRQHMHTRYVLTHLQNWHSSTRILRPSPSLQERLCIHVKGRCSPVPLQNVCVCVCMFVCECVCVRVQMFMSVCVYVLCVHVCICM